LIIGDIIANITRNQTKIKMKDNEIFDFEKQIEDIKEDTNIYYKKLRLKNLEYQISNVKLEFKKIDEERKDKLAIANQQLEILEQKQKINKKKYNKFDTFTTDIEINNIKDEITKLERELGVMPNDLKYKIYTLNDDIRITQKEINYLREKKYKELAKLKRNIKRLKLEKIELENKTKIKSFINGLVVDVVFTMSIEYLMRVRIMILERVE
jgi:hypothetical protein